MTDILDELNDVLRLGGDTYSSTEVLGMVGRAADEIERLCIENAGVIELQTEIERLTAALQRIAAQIEARQKGSSAAWDIRRVALDALAGRKE